MPAQMICAIVNTGREPANTRQVEKTSGTVTKIWDDDNNRDGLRPAEITVNLMQRTGTDDLVDGGGGEQGLQHTGQQHDTALENQHKDGGKHDTDAQTDRQHGGGDQIEHRFGEQHLIVPRQTGIQRADDGHGAHTEQQAGGDKALGDGNLFPFAGELALDPVAQAVDAAVDIQGRADDGAQHHGQDKDDGVFSFQGSRNADIQGAKTDAQHKYNG